MIIIKCLTKRSAYNLHWQFDRIVLAVNENLLLHFHWNNMEMVSIAKPADDNIVKEIDIYSGILTYTECDACRQNNLQ